MASVVVRSRNGYKVVDVRDLIVDDKENIRKGETVRVGSANFSGTVEGVFGECKAYVYIMSDSQLFNTFKLKCYSCVRKIKYENTVVYF